MTAPLRTQGKGDAAPTPVSPATAPVENAREAPRLDRASGRLLGGGAVPVGPPDDKFEREADRVATSVANGGRVAPISDASRTVQRVCAACENEDKEQPPGASAIRLQRRDQTAPGPRVASGRDLPSGGGRPLGHAERSFFEPRLGRDLGAVRLHDDPGAATSASRLAARAFTVGRDIVFGAGELSPGSQAGRRLLAHELTHVAQQGYAPPRAGGPHAAIAPAPKAVQRQPADPAPGAEADDAPEFVTKLQAAIDAAYADADQEDDLALRAHGARLFVLLKRPHAPIANQAQFDSFIDASEDAALTELDTLTALGAWAEFSLATSPKGFPLTWSGRIQAALTLGADPLAILATFMAASAELVVLSLGLSNDIVENGLPLSLANVQRARNFHLSLDEAASPADSYVRTFARATIRYMQLRFVNSFAFIWEMQVKALAEAVAAGKTLIDYTDYKNFIANKQLILQDLPARAMQRLATSDAEAQAFQNDAIAVSDAAVGLGLISAWGGLMSGLFEGWRTGAQLFDAEMHEADAVIAQTGGGECLVKALGWAKENGYFGEAIDEAVDALIANGPMMLLTIAGIMVANLIPGVNIAVDLWLYYTIGRDVIELVHQLGTAMNTTMSAKSVGELQVGAAEVARVLTNGGMQLVMLLVTMGVGKAVTKVRSRAAALRQADAALTDAAAEAQAMKELSSAERAPLERVAETPKMKEWEAGLGKDPANAKILETPGVREKLANTSDAVRKLLTLCETPCLPPGTQLLEADLAQLEAIQQRLGVPGESRALREYFHHRRNSPGGIKKAIEDLDAGAATPKDLGEFLDRDVIARETARLGPGTTITKSGDRFVVRRTGPGGKDIFEYDIFPYREAGSHATEGFFNAHHPAQGQWARENGMPGYVYEDAPTMLLRNTRTGSPHRIITTRQSQRAAGRAARTYPEERAMLRADYEAANVPEAYIQRALAENDAYFGKLYQNAIKAGKKPAQLKVHFGDWTP
jgi:hypothetical protein